MNNFKPGCYSAKHLRVVKSSTFYYLIVLLFIIPDSRLRAQSFHQSTPESEGVSSAGIDSFLNAINKSHNEFHSFMMLRHGKIIAKGWWNPYQPDLKHTMYSTSKSFTSTAVGFAASENKLKVSDKVISFFPDQLPEKTSPYLQALTIKDLLTMSAGQEPDPTTTIPFAGDNWVKAFLATPIVNEPGKKFLYNTMATYMLSAIVQKVTGQKEFDYLKPRLFDPLGITGIDWEISAEGVNTGGWGLRLKTEDMAKLGQLYLQKGVWNGKQLLPKAWIEEATTAKIDQAPGVAQSKRDSSDWMQGYCYQFWRCRHNAFRADGAFGQYIIVMPDQDAVIAITSETANMQDELNLVWQYLLPAIKPGRLPGNSTEEAALKKHLAALSIAPLPAKGAVATGFARTKTFLLQPNDLKLKSVAVTIIKDTCKLVLAGDNGTYNLNFQTGKWLSGKTDMPTPYLLANAKEDFSFLLPYKVAGSFTMPDEKSLSFKLRYVESPHSENINFTFDGNKLKGTIDYSFMYGKNKIELTGEKVD